LTGYLDVVLKKPHVGVREKNSVEES
jgi:hypothetical protein